eukprot:4046655-Amphidinium_carterae.1
MNERTGILGIWSTFPIGLDPQDVSSNMQQHLVMHMSTQRSRTKKDSLDALSRGSVLPSMVNKLAFPLCRRQDS